MPPWPAPQVRATHNPQEGRLPAIPGCPEALQQLIWDCTHPTRHARPTATDVIGRLEALLATL